LIVYRLFVASVAIVKEFFTLSTLIFNGLLNCRALGLLGYQLAMGNKQMTQAPARANIRKLSALGHLGHEIQKTKLTIFI
jgi:hypothetical protein